jgi:hypothetical protein
MRLNNSTRVSINKQLRNETQLSNQARKIIENEFRNIHSKLMNDFESHPVTRELRSGASSPNYSQTLSEGNLFGFIGFTLGEDPISDIERMLENTDIFIKNKKMGQFGFIWTYIVTSPSMSDLYRSTPMPWANGSSWLRELEGRGIPNIGQYMYKRSSVSRSGAGVQNKNRPEGGRVKIPYIKELLKKFEINLNSIQASRISRANF